MKHFVMAFFFLLSMNVNSQSRNSVWCFGDSSGIDFNNLTSPSPIHSKVKSRGTCASICNSGGSLLFYTSYNPQLLWGGNALNGEVYNNEHRLMVGGDSIFYRSWYQEAVIVPFPDDTMKYYLFSVGVTSIFGMYYSVVDMSLDSGRGAVIQKNVQLQNYQADDCIMAIKHGDGRDWWVISRYAGVSNNQFYEYLVSPTGISGPIIQSAGSPTITNNYRFAFSSDGSKMASISSTGIIEMFDFDRCTGLISFDQNISQEVTAGTIPWYVGVAFSPSDKYLYVSQLGLNTDAYLFQFDLMAPDILASCDTIWDYSATPEAAGLLKLAPDGKIYLATAWEDGVHFNYPYPDSVFNTVNNNLSVINYPDSPGVACGFAPFSFNLGAGRCYWGLPNNPDYELGPDTNSLCDTVMQVGSLPDGSQVGKSSQLHVFYNEGWKILFVNAENIKGRDCKLQIFDVNGREVFSSAKKTQPPYFTEDVNCGNLADGIYIVKLQTEKEVLTKKFVKE